MLVAMTESLGRYLEHLCLRRSLLSHSLDSYRNDIEKFRRYLEKLGLDPETLKQAELTGFLDHLRKSGLAPSSIARNLSSIKGYYRFLKRNGETERNPAESITGPRLF